MSLFGSSPEYSPPRNSAHRSKASLFADETANNTSSSLFADDNTSSSHWTTTNANKRASRQELIKTLLPGTDVPGSYVDAYDRVLNAGDRVGAGVGLTSVREILSGSGLSATDQEKILNLVVSGESDGDEGGNVGIGRGEFHVLLALVGLAQEGDELTFDAVDDRRKSGFTTRPFFGRFIIGSGLTVGFMADLPVPKSAYLDQLHANQKPEDDIQAQSKQEQQPATSQAPTEGPFQEPMSTRGQGSRRGSLGGLEADPWAAPDLHRGHEHHQGVLNGFGDEQSVRNSWPDARAFEEAYRQDIAPHGERANGRPDAAPVPPSSSGSGWGGSLTTAAVDSGFGGLGAPRNNPLVPNPLAPNPRRRSLGTSRMTGPLPVQETVTVALLPEKEGLFMFQHRNYEVKSARRASTVIRRYSDFVWLLDCLHRRYPFRQLPLLPPKRISGT